MGLGKGAGCFLIGSGPSLNKVDVTCLGYLPTIAFNRSYIAWKQWGFVPTYYACLDPMVFEDNVPEIRSLIAEYPHTIFYLPSSAESCGIRASEQVSLIRLAHGHRFSTNISSLTDFGNVGATALQILAILGYRRIAMIGVDARYIAVDATSVVADADGFVIANNDTNHFCPEYARGKRRLAHPDYERILGQWPQVAKECADNAIEVRNASPGSALEFFPITDFAAAIDWVRGDSTEQRRDC